MNNKSNLHTPAFVGILFICGIVCILALAWLPIKGALWLYQSKVAAQNQAAADGRQWMEQVKEAVMPIPVEEVVTQPSPKNEERTEEPTGTSTTVLDAVEKTEPTTPDLQKAIIAELRQLPNQTTKRRKAWAAICRATKVTGGTRVRDGNLETQADFLLKHQVPLHRVSEAVKTVLAA